MRNRGRIRGRLARRSICILAVSGATRYAPGSSLGATASSWLAPVSGSWTDGTKWSTAPFFPNNGEPLGTTYDVTIGSPNVPFDVLADQPIAIETFVMNAPAATLTAITQLDVAAAACLQIAAVGGRPHRRDVEKLELAGILQLRAHQIADAYQPVVLVGLRPPHLALEAGIEQFEIENGEFRRLGARRHRPQHYQRGNGKERSHDRDPRPRLSSNDEMRTCKLGQFGHVSRQECLHDKRSSIDVKSRRRIRERP